MTKSRGSTPKRSKSSATTCGGDTLASIATSQEREPLIAAFDQHHLRAARKAWQGRAHDAQVPPPGDWSTWLFLGGQRAGKTWAGAQWLSARADEAGGRRS